MEVTKEMIEEAMVGAVEALKNQLTEELKRGITYDIRDAATRQIIDFVKDWVSENLLPVIEADLLKGKDGLISIGSGIAPTIVDAIDEAISDSIKESLASSYKRRELFKAILG